MTVERDRKELKNYIFVDTDYYPVAISEDYLEKSNLESINRRLEIL